MSDAVMSGSVTSDTDSRDGHLPGGRRLARSRLRDHVYWGLNATTPAAQYIAAPKLASKLVAPVPLNTW